MERWHPGQHWIWAADGFGVLDPGINALSILTLIWPGPWTVTQSTPTIAAGAGAPERVEAGLACGPVAATVLFDWRSPSDRWDIVVELADGGQLALTAGGAQLVVDGVAQPVADHGEYDAVYAAFADCLAQRHSRIDVQPLELALAMLR